MLSVARGRSWQLGFYVVWERTVEEDRDFRVAEVIEGSHYRYTVASLLSFALLMIYRKQINDLYFSKQITKDIAYLCQSDRVQGFLPLPFLSITPLLFLIFTLPLFRPCRRTGKQIGLWTFIFRLAAYVSYVWYARTYRGNM